MGAPEPGVGTGIRGGLPDTADEGVFVNLALAKRPGGVWGKFLPNGLLVTAPCDSGVKPAA